MNIIKKFYCRCYQLVFKIALPILPYRDPKIEYNIEGVVSILKEKNLSKPLIVTDQGLYNLGIHNILTSVLEANDIPYAIFHDVVANPTSKNVNVGLGAYQANSCDSIIALGGGSAMDCAKAIGARIVYPNKNLKDLAGILHVRRKIPTLIAIPTTAGTGSETTLASVIVDSDTRHKYVINSFPLIPSYAVLDSKFTETLPKSIVSTTGMDALTHALESYLGRSGNKSTRRDGLKAMKLIFDNLLEAYETNSKESRDNMLYAAHLAGRAFTKAYVGNVHALAHALGGKYNTPHGLANAVILPIVLKDYSKRIYKKMKKIAIYLGLADKKAKPKDCYDMILNKIIEMNEKMNIPSTIQGIKLEDIREMASYANHEANPLYPSPALYNKKKFMEMYKIIGGLNDW